MALAWILVQKSDNRVVGVNKTPKNPGPADPNEEFHENWIGDNWSGFEIFRTGVDAYNNTGVQLKTNTQLAWEADVDAQMDASNTLPSLRATLKDLLKQVRIR